MEAELAEEEVVVEVLPEEAAVEEDVSATERLKLEAKSLEHQVSHFPKNPFCSICSIARMTSARVDHTGKKDKTDNLPIPESFGKMLMADNIIVAQEEEDAGKGAAGERTALIVKDAYSGARMIYPSTRRTKEANMLGLQKFLGPALSSSKVILKSDAAKELVGAAETLGWLPETSLPNRWPHNTTLERDVRHIKECTRAVHYQAGFDHELWPVSIQFAATTLNCTQEASHDSTKSRWEAVTGEDFSGTKIPLGALVYYRNKNHETFSTGAAPGIFA